MNRPKPKTFSGETQSIFAYYDVREINEYLAALEQEIRDLKRTNEGLRLQVLGP